MMCTSKLAECLYVCNLICFTDFCFNCFICQQFCGVICKVFKKIESKQATTSSFVFQLRFFDVNPGTDSGDKLAVSWRVFTIQYLVAEQIV